MVQPTGSPPELRPAAGFCSHWIGVERRYCRGREGVRRYVPGYRCQLHTPNAVRGLPEAPAGPGIPAYRKAGER